MLKAVAAVAMCIALALPVRHTTAWEPDPADVALIARTVWGEARGCEDYEREAVAWCILNRVTDPRFPDSVEGVVTAAYQFAGYSANNPLTDELATMAADVLTRWHYGERGIPEALVYFIGDGQHNYFTDKYGSDVYYVFDQWKDGF